MTIKEFSKKMGITPQAVYQKMKNSSIDLNSIKDAKTGELTDEGLEILNNLFSKGGASEGKENAALIDKITALKNELNAERVKSEFLNKRIEELEADRDRWYKEAMEQRELVKEAHKSIAVQAQAVGASNVKLLMESGKVNPRKLTLRERITGRIKQDPPEAAAAEQK